MIAYGIMPLMGPRSGGRETVRLAEGICPTPPAARWGLAGCPPGQSVQQTWLAARPSQLASGPTAPGQAILLDCLASLAGQRLAGWLAQGPCSMQHAAGLAAWPGWLAGWLASPLGLAGQPAAWPVRLASRPDPSRPDSSWLASLCLAWLAGLLAWPLGWPGLLAGFAGHGQLAQPVDRPGWLAWPQLAWLADPTRNRQITDVRGMRNSSKTDVRGMRNSSKTDVRGMRNSNKTDVR